MTIYGFRAYVVFAASEVCAVGAYCYWRGEPMSSLAMFFQHVVLSCLMIVN